jgi:hypothetical protein
MVLVSRKTSVLPAYFFDLFHPDMKLDTKFIKKSSNPRIADHFSSHQIPEGRFGFARTRSFKC